MRRSVISLPKHDIEYDAVAKAVLVFWRVVQIGSMIEKVRE